MLDLVDTPKRDVVMTTLGWYFLAAPLPARKTIFKKQILELRIFQMITDQPDASPSGRIREDDILEQFSTLLPYDQPENLFASIIAWGRYAEIIDYDPHTGMMSMQTQDVDDAHNNE